MRTSTEVALSTALQQHASRKDETSGSWSHAEISTAVVAAALAEMAAFPRMSEAGILLARQARLVMQLRQALLRCDWSRAATWEAVVVVLESSEAVEYGAALPEVRAAQREFGDMRVATELAVADALQNDRSAQVRISLLHTHPVIAPPSTSLYVVCRWMGNGATTGCARRWLRRP